MANIPHAVAGVMESNKPPISKQIAYAVAIAKQPVQAAAVPVAKQPVQAAAVPVAKQPVHAVAIAATTKAAQTAAVSVVGQAVHPDAQLPAAKQPDLAMIPGPGAGRLIHASELALDREKADIDYENILKIVPFGRRLISMKQASAYYHPEKVAITRCQIYLEEFRDYICLVFPSNTFIRLPDNHPWRQLEPHIPVRRGGFPLKTIGLASTIEHLPWSKLSLKIRQLLMARFSREEIKHIFIDDILNELGKSTNRNWINLRYDVEEDADWLNMNPVSLPYEYRVKDCDNAIKAIESASSKYKKDAANPAKRSVDAIAIEEPESKRADTKQNDGDK